MGAVLAPAAEVSLLSCIGHLLAVIVGCIFIYTTYRTM